MGFDFIGPLIGIGIGVAAYWAYDNGYITIPPITLPPLPCPTGQHRDTAGNCVADTPAAYARALRARGYYGRRRY